MRAGILAGTELETRSEHGRRKNDRNTAGNTTEHGSSGRRKKERGVSVYTELLSKGMDGQWARVRSQHSISPCVFCPCQIVLMLTGILI